MPTGTTAPAVVRHWLRLTWHSPQAIAVPGRHGLDLGPLPPRPVRSIRLAHLSPSRARGSSLAWPVETFAHGMRNLVITARWKAGRPSQAVLERVVLFRVRLGG